MRAAAEKRRKEILEAALDCFAARGYAATTLDDIRSRSGASTGSIYHLFEGKEEIGGALYLEGLQAWHDGLLRVLRAQKNPEVAVRAVVDYYLDWVTRSPKMARFILHTRQAELLPSARHQIRAHNREFFGEIKQLIEPHVAKGRLRKLPLELFTALVLGPCLEYARQWLAGVTRVPMETARELIADGVWAAVSRGRPASRRPGSARSS